MVLGREAGSGTRDAFEELLEVKDSCQYAQELDSTGAVLAKVSSTPGAIGYVSLDVVYSTVNSSLQEFVLLWVQPHQSLSQLLYYQLHQGIHNRLHLVLMKP